MCWMAAIPIAMSAASSAMSSNAAVKATAAENTAQRQMSIQQVSEMNYTDSNLKMQQADLLDDLRSQKTANNMQQVRNMGTLRTALGESGLEGNSMSRLSRVTEGDYIRQEQGLNDNYERDYSKIFGDRVSNIEGTRNAIDTRNRSEKKAPNAITQLLGGVINVGGTASAQYASGGFDSKTKTKGGGK